MTVKLKLNLLIPIHMFYITNSFILNLFLLLPSGKQAYFKINVAQKTHNYSFHTLNLYFTDNAICLKLLCSFTDSEIAQVLSGKWPTVTESKCETKISTQKTYNSQNQNILTSEFYTFIHFIPYYYTLSSKIVLNN